MPSRRQVLQATASVSIVGIAGCTDVTRLDFLESEQTTVVQNDDSVAIAVTDGDEEIPLVTYGQIRSAGEVREAQFGQDGYSLPVELSDGGLESFTEGLESAGALDAPEDHEILTYVDGEVVSRAALAPNLADHIETGDWAGEFVLLFEDRDHAGWIQERIQDS